MLIGALTGGASALFVFFVFFPVAVAFLPLLRPLPAIDVVVVVVVVAVVKMLSSSAGGSPSDINEGASEKLVRFDCVDNLEVCEDLD